MLSGTKPIVRIFILVFLFLCLIPVATYEYSQNREVSLFDLLKKYIRYSDSDLAGISQGRVMARMLDTKDKREVSGIGIIRVDISREEFLKRYRDIENFKQGSEVLQIGKLGNPAKISEIRALTFEHEDLNDLKNCKPGSCALKLPANWITQLSEAARSAVNAEAKTNELLRQLLIDYTNEYMVRGKTALTTYDHDKHPLSISEDFSSLVLDTGFLQDYAPEFAKYLLDFPQNELPDAETFVYWSKEKFGLKAVISLTQVIICRRKGENRNELLIATKQLFADHYFDSSLGFAIFSEQSRRSRLPGNYLIYLNQSRADALRGFMTGLRRSVVESRSLTALKNNMKVIKQRLEKPVIKTPRESARE